MSENTYKGEGRWYDIQDLDSDDEAQDVPLENLLSAAAFVTSILKEAGVTCGVLGGLGIVLHGIERDTVDVDIGISSEKGWRLVRQVLDAHLGRLKLPKTKLVADTLRMFCRTGAPWDKCKEAVEVEVDLLSKVEITQMDDPSFWITSDGPIPVFTPIALFRLKLVTLSRREAFRDLLDLDALVRKLTPEKILDSKDNIIRHLGDEEASVVQKVPPAYKELIAVLQKLFDV